MPLGAVGNKDADTTNVDSGGWCDAPLGSNLANLVHGRLCCVCVCGKGVRVGCGMMMYRQDRNEELDNWYGHVRPLSLFCSPRAAEGRINQSKTVPVYRHDSLSVMKPEDDSIGGNTKK